MRESLLVKFLPGVFVIDIVEPNTFDSNNEFVAAMSLKEWTHAYVVNAHHTQILAQVYEV